MPDTAILRSATLGGVDGVVTSFAIAAGAHAGGFGTRVAAVIGYSSLLSDGASMAASEYLSVYAEQIVATSSSTTPVLLHPLRAGAVCFVSFVTCGAFPLTVYVASGGIVACAAFATVTLMLLGAARTVATQEPLLRVLGQTSVLGGVAGAIAYVVAYVAHEVE